MYPGSEAGWYRADHAAGELRYWDGDRWLDIPPPSTPGPQVSPPPSSSTPPTTNPDAASEAETEPEPGRVKPLSAKKMAIVIGIALIVTLAGVWLAAPLAPVTPRTVATPEATPSTRDSASDDRGPSYPYGFKELSAFQGLAIRWVDRDCGYSQGRCSHAEIWAADGCPTRLYVEVNFLDASGTVIDYGNDAVGRLQAPSKALLEFTTFDDDARRVEVTEASCY